MSREINIKQCQEAKNRTRQAQGPLIRPTQIPLPGKFEEANSPQAPDTWPKWLRQFDRYRAVSGLNSKPPTKQVSTLLYAMGDSADDILQTLRLEEGTVSYNEIKKSLNDYFAER